MGYGSIFLQTASLPGQGERPIGAWIRNLWFGRAASLPFDIVISTVALPDIPLRLDGAPRYGRSIPLHRWPAPSIAARCTLACSASK